MTSFIVTTYTILVRSCYFLPGTAGRVVQIGSKLLIGLRIYDSDTPLLSHLRLYPSSKAGFKNELELGQILFSHAIPWSPGSVLPYTMRILLSVKPFHTCPPPKRDVGPDNSPWAGYRSPRLPTLTGAPSLIALWLETIYVAVVVLHVYVSLASTCSRVMLFPGCHGGVMRYVGPPLFDRVIVTDSGTGNFSFKFSLVSTQETHSLRLQRVLHYL